MRVESVRASVVGRRSSVEFNTHESVSFCTLSSRSFFPSSPSSSASFSTFFSISRRTFLMATLPSSPILLATLVISVLLSAVSCGTFIRITFPSLLGVMSTSDPRIARSMSGMALRSKGWMTSSDASGVVMDAIWLSGVGAP